MTENKAPTWAKRVRVKYPDGSEYFCLVEELPYYQRQAEKLYNSLLTNKGASEEIASRALFKIVEYLP